MASRSAGGDVEQRPGGLTLLDDEASGCCPSAAARLASSEGVQEAVGGEDPGIFFMVDGLASEPDADVDEGPNALTRAIFVALTAELPSNDLPTFDYQSREPSTASRGGSERSRGLSTAIPVPTELASTGADPQGRAAQRVAGASADALAVGPPTTHDRLQAPTPALELVDLVRRLEVLQRGLRDGSWLAGTAHQIAKAAGEEAAAQAQAHRFAFADHLAVEADGAEVFVERSIVEHVVARLPKARVIASSAAALYSDADTSREGWAQELPVQWEYSGCRRPLPGPVACRPPPALTRRPGGAPAEAREWREMDL